MPKLLKQFYIRLMGLYLNTYALIFKKKAAEKAFEVFCTVRKGRVQPKQAPFLDSARDKTIEVSGHQIQTYLWEGTGPKVLLIHGWESNTFRWRNLIPLLQESGFGVVAFDAPGHGHSSGNRLHVPLYTECVDAVVRLYQPKHIIGHSVGGMTAVYYEHKHLNPSIDKMVTIGSPSEFYKIMDQYKEILHLSNRLMDALDKLIFSHFGFYIHDFSSPKFVENNSKKALIVHDKQDKVVPYEASERVHNAWENSVLISTEGLGHSMHQEEVNKKIIHFLLED